MQPPKTFNKSRYIFDPFDNDREIQIEGVFLDQVHKLVNQRRFRTALDTVLKELAVKPNSSDLYRLAGLVLHTSRTEQLQANEPITESQYNDTRLDPLFTQCSSCHKTWVTLESVLPFATVSKANTAALQCYDCGYVMCRDCYETGMDRSICKNCNSTNLRSRIYPTGRDSRQFQRSEQPVQIVMLYREGPIQPSNEDIVEILQSLSPDALEDNAAVVGLPVPEWPLTDSEDMIYTVRQEIETYHKQGLLPLGRETSQVMYFTKDDLRYVLAKLLMPKAERQILFEAMTNRIGSAIKENQDDPRLVATKPLLHRCIEAPMLKFTMNVISNQGREALKDGKPKYFVDRFDDIAIVVYVIPALNHNIVREDLGDHFDANARKYVEMLRIDPDQVNIAYWFVHTDGQQQQIYFSFIPNSSELLHIRGVGLPSGDSLEIDWGYIYWFDWTKISDSGEPRYGEYVFKKVIPFFMPESLSNFHSAFFFDGDVDPKENTSITPLSTEDANCLAAVQNCGISNCYAMGVLGDKKTLDQIDQGLRSSSVEAYLGRISWRGQGMNGFVELTDKLGLDFLVHISGKTFEKNDFGYLSDDELLTMGFLPREFGE